MKKQLARIAAAATTVAMVTLTGLTVAPASADTAPVINTAGTPSVIKTRFVAHFDLAQGQMPENIALEPNGTASVTFAASRQVAAVTPAGSTRVLATMQAPADGGVKTPVLGFALTTGIARAHDGTLYFLYASGTEDLTGLWRLRPGGTPHRIAALPANGLPNGLALDERNGVLYIADSVLGTIFTVPAAGGEAAPWSSATELAPAGFLGANGLKIHDCALWVTNLDRGTVLRIPFRPGNRPGPVQTRAGNLVGIDDFAFTGNGDEILAALNAPNTVVRIRGNGAKSTVLTAADGLQNPTSVALLRGTAYVASAAYTTATDPNLLLARIPHSR